MLEIELNIGSRSDLQAQGAAVPGVGQHGAGCHEPDRPSAVCSCSSYLGSDLPNMFVNIPWLTKEQSTSARGELCCDGSRGVTDACWPWGACRRWGACWPWGACRRWGVRAGAGACVPALGRVPALGHVLALGRACWRGSRVPEGTAVPHPRLRLFRRAGRRLCPTQRGFKGQGCSGITPPNKSPQSWCCHSR